MAEIAVSLAVFVIEKVIEILLKKAREKRASVHESVYALQRSLERMQAFLKDTENDESTAALQKQIQQVREVAYEIEDELDNFIISVHPNSHSHRISKHAHDCVHFLSNYNSLSDLYATMEKLDKKIDSLALPSPGYRHDANLNLQQGFGRREDDVMHQILEEDEIIGYVQQQNTILMEIVAGKSRTLSIVGPCGAGKTLLMRKIYQNKLIKEEYSCYAWIDMSPPFEHNRVLSTMLVQFFGAQNAQPPELVAESLSQHLTGERFLVVLDNIETKQDCDWIRNALPKGLPGSKIIVITRDSSVASTCADSTNHSITLDGLLKEEAWDLFIKKVFGIRGTCPDDLVSWAEKIIEKCECMPFAVAAAGSFLSKIPKIPVDWEKFYYSFGTETRTDSKSWIISRMLLGSFKDLPSHLKICFLYFSIFPENYPVERGRLIRSWIAEGFVKEEPSKTLEEVAEEYLKELIQKNIVITISKGLKGKVKTCRVSKLFREVIVAKSKEEIFVEVFSESNKNLSERVRHLAVHAVRPSADFSTLQKCSFVRALFVFEKNISSDVIQKLCHQYKFLKTLDLQGTSLKKFPKVICDLILLRYLSLRETDVQKIPNNIKNLTLLETLDLKQTYVIELPNEISKLQNLRHLLVSRYNAKIYVEYNSVSGIEVSAGIENLSSLQKLSLINVSQVNLKKFGKLIELRKLGLTHLKYEDGKDLCSSIKEMRNLSTLDVRSCEHEILNLDSLKEPPKNLQRLYLKGCLKEVPIWISSLQSLIKINLKWSKLKAHTDPLKTIESLPHLMELHLTDFYCGSDLKFEAGKFQKLKILLLEHFDHLHKVKIEFSSMPLLEKFTIIKCKKLRLLPSGIDGLHRLEELHFHEMPLEFIARLRKGSPERYMVDHVRLIQCYTLRKKYPWFLKENLS